MKKICSICARGGSKGVPGKNTKLLLNKPLIIHTLEHAKQANIFEYIAVSSDDTEILNVAEKWGADFLVKRPIELADDMAPKIPAIQHCIRTVEKQLNVRFDIVVDLDATSPLREANDILNAVNLLESRNVSNILTGYISRRSPYFNLVELNQDGFVDLSKPNNNVFRRQDSPICYDLNGSIYVWKRDKLFDATSVIHADTLLYEMPYERSIDIDCPLDFEFVEFLMKRKI